MFWLLVTFIIACIGAFICYRFKFAGGVLVGALFSVAVFNIFTGKAYFPMYAKIFAQIISGAFIGVRINRSNLTQLKQAIKPAILLIVGMLIINLIIGFSIYALSPLNLTTSLLSAVPGGVSSISFISHEMGADTSKVAVMQFIRLISSLALFPIIIKKANQHLPDAVEYNAINQNEFVEERGVKEAFYTLITALVFGILGSISGIPAGTLVFSIFGVSCFNIITDKAYIHLPVKRFAQVLSGAFIGTSFVRDDLAQFKSLILPALILIIGYIILCTLLGIIISRIFKIDIVTSLFSSTPAGASDMAFIASDFGANSPTVAFLQVARLISVIAFFPWVIQLIVFLTGK
jgi:membrane AbrB-like protein